MHSSTYLMLAEAMACRQQVLCAFGGTPRELCPIVLGHSDGKEMVLAYQFGGASSTGLAPGGEWRCFTVAGISDVSLRDGPWLTGSSHEQPQACVKEVDLDVNPDSPYAPKRRLRTQRSQR
jgi:hypothetical protein